MSVSPKKSYAHPALVANRFKESSLSPIARTWPPRAKVVDVGSALPFSSTSAMAIWTEAWSLEVMRRSATCQYGPLELGNPKTHWSPRTCGGRRGRREHPERSGISSTISSLASDEPRKRTWSFSMLTCGDLLRAAAGA